MSESPFPEIAHPQKRAFLAAFRETGNVRLACEVAKVGRSSHYQWLEKDPEYREAFDLAKEDAADILEAEAHRRAVEGVEEPVGWYKGVSGGTVRRYSDVPPHVPPQRGEAGSVPRARALRARQTAAKTAVGTVGEGLWDLRRYWPLR